VLFISETARDRIGTKGFCDKGIVLNIKTVISNLGVMLTAKQRWDELFRNGEKNTAIYQYIPCKGH